MVNRSLSPGTFFRQKGFNRIGLLMNCLATVQLFSYLINTIQGLECNQLPKPHYSVLSSRMGPRMAHGFRPTGVACRPESLHARRGLRFAIGSGWGRVPDVVLCAARFAPCTTLYAVIARRSWLFLPFRSPLPFSVLPQNSAFSEFQARGRGGCKRF